jgi:hypothetical protein
MLIEDGTTTPESLVLRTEPYSAGWSFILKSTSHELGRHLESAGWTFFYMAGEIRSTAFGFKDQSRTARALTHAMEAAKLQNCNCLEIDQIRHRSFLGLPYTTLGAHARHIQRSRMFRNTSLRTGCDESKRRDSAKYGFSPARSQTLFTGEGVEAWENEGGSRAESRRPSLEVSSA